MEEAVHDLSGIVTRLTGVDFKTQVGIMLEEATPARGVRGTRPPSEGLAEPRAPPYQSPIGKVFNHLFEPLVEQSLERKAPGEFGEPDTPILTPASKAAVSAVLGWNQSTRRGKVGRVPFDAR